MSDQAERTVKRGNQYPFDAPDGWWVWNGNNPPKAETWQQSAARGVIADLTDRAGIKHGFNEIDESIRKEIVESLADIIEFAYKDFAK